MTLLMFNNSCHYCTDLTIKIDLYFVKLLDYFEDAGTITFLNNQISLCSFNKNINKSNEI